MTTTEPTLDDALSQFTTGSEAPSMDPEPNLLVELPGGWRNPEGELLTLASVREMTGLDEENIARLRASVARDGAKSKRTMVHVVDEILTDLVLKIEDVPMTAEIAPQLLVGDREALLLGIRSASFGPTFEMLVTCPFCSHEMNVEFDIDKDIDMRAVAAEDTYTVPLSRGREARVTLPTGATQHAMTKGSSDRTIPEMNTLLLADVLVELNGLSVGDMRDGALPAVQAMSVADRRTLLTALVDAQPGPRLGEVKIECTKCNEDIPTPMDALDLLFL